MYGLTRLPGHDFVPAALGEPRTQFGGRQAQRGKIGVRGQRYAFYFAPVASVSRPILPMLTYDQHRHHEAFDVAQ